MHYVTNRIFIVLLYTRVYHLCTCNPVLYSCTGATLSYYSVYKYMLTTNIIIFMLLCCTVSLAISKEITLSALVWGITIHYNTIGLGTHPWVGTTNRWFLEQASLLILYSSCMEFNVLVYQRIDLVDRPSTSSWAYTENFK